MVERSRDPIPDEVSTVLRARAVDATVRAATYRITVLDGKDAGKTFDLGGAQEGRTLAGKSHACLVRLSDPHVSRRHAAFDARNGELRLCDLGSSNGTFVNGVRIVEAFLLGGETIRFGETALRLEVADAQARVEIPSATSFGRVVGSSTAMRMLYPLFAKLAASDVAVLIEGETGTGKEVLAEALHEAGPRALGPFVVFDCTAVPPNLVESELFGHERGAFTGAVASRKGVFEQAHGGTLLIDEIGDLEPSLQPKLLRALERSEVRRVGGDRWNKVDVRVIAATRRDLDREVQDGRFRDDLFFRIAVARVELPPLRLRHGDITPLTHHFASLLGIDPKTIPYELLDRFEHYAWPGNLRELANAVGRYAVLGDEKVLPSQGVPPTTSPSARDPIQDVLALELPLTLARQRLVAEFERRYVESVLAKHGGNIARAAEASGIARRYFNVLLVRQRGQTT
jgi:DNA-binding NtrC family response regulator